MSWVEKEVIFEDDVERLIHFFPTCHFIIYIGAKHWAYKKLEAAKIYDKNTPCILQRMFIKSTVRI